MSRFYNIAIKTSVPNHEVAASWGDYHFALGLQRAFNRLGHNARTDLQSEWASAASASDDVILVLRGGQRYIPTLRHINLLWVISHPELLVQSEYECYDHVFVASNHFARGLNLAGEVPIKTLLQCTDPEIFTPASVPIPDAEPLLFVGNSRNVFRPIVRDSILAGLEPAVYGTLWPQFIGKKYLRGEGIPNTELGRYYSSAAIVLNDHWQKMGEHGFLSNRLFDAGASGAFVISDRVVGIDEVFEGKIITYETPADLAAKVRHFLSDPRHRAEVVRGLRELVCSAHTFDHRANEIVAAVDELMRQPEIEKRQQRRPRGMEGRAETQTLSFRHTLQYGKSAIADTAKSWRSKIAKRVNRRLSKKLVSKYPAEWALFNRRWYLKRYPEVAAAKAEPFVHFLAKVRKETHDPNSLFDSSWYLRENPAAKESGIHPLSHYLAEGASAGRDPHPLFSTSWYVRQNPEISDRELNPLEHYLTIGRSEGRQPHPSFQNLKIPQGTILPAGIRAAVATSPVLCRVPPGRYLLPYQKAPTQPNLSGALDSYFGRAIIDPNTISSALNENNIRIVSSMDDLKRRLAIKFQNAPQSELVSIVIATRNRAEILPHSIASVVLQSYRNWQLIVVDDAGSDGTQETVSEFKDDRIDYIRLPSQQGPAGARNAGLVRATGSIIAFLDDDDQWDPDFLLLSVNKMREDGKRMIYSAQMIWRDFDPVLQLGYDFKGVRYAPFNRSLLEHANYISMIAVAFDRELLLECGTFNESLNRYVDWDLFLRFVEVETPASLPCVLSHYFQGRDRFNVSRVNDRKSNLTKLRNITIARAGGGFEYRSPLEDVTRTGFFTPEETRKKRAEKLSGIPPKREIGIVIPNFESIDALAACIESVAKHTSQSYRIIVSDNGSSQATREELDRLMARYDQMRWISANQGEGFSFAVNAGLAELIGAGIDAVILNNDTVVTPNWLDELLYVMAKHSQVGMAVPRQVLAAGSSIGKSHVPGTMLTFELDISLSAHHDNVVDPFFDAEEGFVELNYAPLFCALIKAETLDKLGFLDADNGPHYRSDWIYCNALREWVGQKIVYTPYSKVYHLHGVATHQRLISKN